MYPSARRQRGDAHFEARLAKVERERDEYKKLANLLQQQVERIKRGSLGQKAERLPKNDAQLSLTSAGQEEAQALQRRMPDSDEHRHPS